MNKWFNKQKPITLGFITGISCFILGFTLMMLADENILGYKNNLKISFLLSVLMFFMSWLLFSIGKKSSIILYFYLCWRNIFKL